MTADQRPEIPLGFTLKEVPSINAKFLMPAEWFFKEQSLFDTRGAFMSREPIDQRRYFLTGLSVNVLENINKKTGRHPSAMAKGLITRHPALLPTSDVVTTVEGDLITYRRFFLFRGGQLMGRKHEPTGFYMETTANNRTDVMYSIMFESPDRLWETDKEIGRTMIDNRILDPNI